MPGFYEYELGKTADVICRELFELKPGETLVVTADTESDERVVDAVARAAFACGAKPLVVWTASPLGVGKAADAMLPVESLTALLKTADAWVEFNNEWLLYSTAYDKAMEENERLRHLCLVGADPDLLVRCIGRIDYEVLGEFETRVAEMTYAAQHVRLTTPAGEDVEFDNCHESWGDAWPDLGRASQPGSYFLAGQISWVIDLESINGTIVFDGSLGPPFATVLSEPVVLTVERGVITKVEGGTEAQKFDVWTRSFDHPQMRRLAHVCYGFNPGAKLSGNILEDERVWGSTQWGIGHVTPDLWPGGMNGPSHCDGICLNTSVWLDGVQFMDKGQVLDPHLKELARKLVSACRS
jgi:leucyl aminopeptidase (aminopeptidase T)